MQFIWYNGKGHQEGVDSMIPTYHLTVGYVDGHTEDYYSSVKRELIKTEKDLVDMFEDQIEYTNLTEVTS